MLLPLPRCATTARPGCGLRIEAPEHARDIFVRQPVKPVTTHAALGDRRRQRERLRDLGLHAMKRRIEARDLRQIGTKLTEYLDRLEVVRLMQRRERRQLRERGHHFGRDEHGLGEVHAAMHDAMPDRHEVMIGALAAQEFDQVMDRAVVPQFGAARPGVRADLGMVGVVRREMRLGVDAFDLPVQKERERVARGIEDAELDARRTCVEHENHIGHDLTPAILRFRGVPSRRVPRPRTTRGA